METLRYKEIDYVIRNPEGMKEGENIPSLSIFTVREEEAEIFL